MSERIRVILADDHPLVLEGLDSLLGSEPDISVLATATNGDALLEVVEQFRPDVVIVDVKMPVADGLTCLERVRRISPETRVLMLTAYADGETMQSVLSAGADGLLLKTDPPQQVALAIRQVMAGQLVFPAAVRRWVGDAARRRSLAPLSERESEVLALVAEGLSNREVSEKLFVSENTVKFHLQNIFQRLGVSNRTEASHWYMRVTRRRP